MQKKYLKVLSISMIIICLLGLGISFGYYLISNRQDVNNIAGSKCFKLELSNSKNEINLTNMYPISDEEGRKLTPYSFTITNTCDMLAGYTVNMEMLEGTTLNSKYLDVMVNNEEIKLLNSYEETSTVIDGSTEARILAKGTLAYNDTVDYTVKFWMDKDVEDVDAMNKYFASKIVIDATPSSWSPVNAGYDTLHDAVLANEYQSTPEDALKKIEAKGVPDLSNTAPIIKWVEKTGGTITVNVTKPASIAIKSDDATSNLTENDTKIILYKTKIFNSDTARYNLSNSVYVDPTTIDFSDDTKYYFISESISYNQSSKKLYTMNSGTSTNVYQITNATKVIGNTTWNGVSYDSVTYKLSGVTLTETELETDKSDKGLYQGTDDYGATYYYRGNVKNNNVYFANIYWQIVRINGDGSIRLIYNGTEKDAIGVKKSIYEKLYKFNTWDSKIAYVGYMYGDVNGTTFDEVHNNIYNSAIKSTVDNWYKANIEEKNYGSYISTNVGFCGDRSIYSGGDGVQTDKTTYFGPYGRYANNKPQFSCPELNRDLYTTSDANIGNKALTYPVGLITYDEAAFAGLDSKHSNKLSWIYSTQHTWTMSPTLFLPSTNAAYDNYINSGGFISIYGNGPCTFATRPVINLKPDVKITGGIGTSNDPFVIETN